MRAITVKKLVKAYGSLAAVDDISFEVETGSVFAFLGTNGAGKSTTIGCITTTHNITSGEITVNGHTVGQDDDAIRREIGVVFQASLLDDLLTVRENLASRAAFYKLGVATPARITELAKTLGIDSFLDQRYGTLSGGQKRRADIARALIHKPNILFLDEPTAGLDPSSREQVWQTIYDLQAATNLTVFLTTHYMEETERADQVYVIDKGAVVAHGTPAGLRADFSKDQLRLTAVRQEDLIAILSKDKVPHAVKNDTVLINAGSGKAALQLLKKYEIYIKDFEFVHGNMDDVFLALTENHDKPTEDAA